MQCGYFDRNECRSCTFMGEPYAEQLARGELLVRTALPMIAANVWQDAYAGPESGFRNKAKLVVGGQRGAVTLGILDAGGNGVDLTGCGLYEPALAAALIPLRTVVDDLGLTPYDVPRRSGELKNILLTLSPSGDLMIRFVLRSQGQLGKLRAGLDRLRAALPNTRVITANLLPDHKAVTEGDEEIALSDAATLPMRLGPITLHLGPRSFFQTNTDVATALYQQAAQWAAEAPAERLVDLFCGVGGFALHCAGAAQQVVGVEISADAARFAQRSADELHSSTDFAFHAGDSAQLLSLAGDPDLVIVNPPRRGIGAQVCDWIEKSTASRLLYSSCNPTSLAADLARLPSFTATHARLFDMFPQTAHHEVLVALQR
ncbi:methyltransferase domain-containing protein [Calidifontibacter terrae]